MPTSEIGSFRTICFSIHLQVLARMCWFRFAKKVLRPGGVCGNQHYLIERFTVFHSVGSFCQKAQTAPPLRVPDPLLLPVSVFALLKTAGCLARIDHELYLVTYSEIARSQ